MTTLLYIWTSSKNAVIRRAVLQSRIICVVSFLFSAFRANILLFHNLKVLALRIGSKIKVLTLYQYYDLAGYEVEGRR